MKDESSLSGWILVPTRERGNPLKDESSLSGFILHPSEGGVLREQAPNGRNPTVRRPRGPRP
jgi:hypothetical protein